MKDLEKRIQTFLRKDPTIGKNVFIAPGAVVAGDVTLGDNSSVWFNAVLRGDINSIVIGRHTNIQDAAVLHVADQYECEVGDYTTVGHGAVVHASKVGHEVLIGMHATILDGAVVGEQSIVGAAALVPQQMRIPPGSLVWGVPAMLVRALTPAERAQIKTFAERYCQLSPHYLARAPRQLPTS